MSRENIRYSRIGFCGILGDDGEVIWSNEPHLFRKMTASKRFAAAFGKTGTELNPYEHCMTYDGVRFRITVLPLPDRRFLCVAYPEECYMRFAHSEIYAQLSGIRQNAFGSLSFINDLKSELGEMDLPDGACELMDKIAETSGKIYSDSAAMMKLFDEEHICEYVLIGELLKNAYAQIRKYNSCTGRNVSLDIEVRRSVARINSAVFVSALFAAVRLMYRLLPEGGSTVLKITENKEGWIMISGDAEVLSENDIPDLDSDIGNIRCSFECLCGTSKIYRKGKRVVIRAGAPASLSNYTGRVKNDDGDGETHEEILRGYAGVLTAVEGSPEFREQGTVPVMSVTMLLADLFFEDLFAENDAGRKIKD